jgi:uncharacterized protein YPO0396
MARPKIEKNSSDTAAEIARLEQEKRRLIHVEDQRRGAIIRECLSGSSGNQLRDALRAVVSPRDSVLFNLESASNTPDRSLTTRTRRRTGDATSQPSTEAR